LTAKEAIAKKEAN